MAAKLNCGRLHCGHPRKESGDKRGHFGANGRGPCREPLCDCIGFVGPGYAQKRLGDRTRVKSQNV